ncbi:MAG TPA: PAS domain S-box protein, partial [Actinomycetota bacterium]|nr:PAS domain S-box protein [Actinomycetota bacterium]
NPAFGRMTGFADAAGKTSLELNPDAEPYWFETLGRVAQTGEDVRFERYAEALDRWFDVYASRVGGEGSRRVAIVFTNTTEPKRAEEALRESEELHRLIVEGARDYAIFTTDLQGRIKSWPPGAASIFGWTAEEAIGQPLAMLDVPEDQASRESKNELATAREKAAAADVRWHLRKDGSRVFIEGMTRYLRDARGLPRGFLKIGQDVTQRREAETALRESEATLNSILNSLAEGVLVADAQGHVVFANSAARTMLGVTGEEALDELPDPWEGFNLPEAVAHCTRNGEGIEAGVRYGETFLRVKLECLAGTEQGRGEVLVVIQDLSAGHQLEANQQRFLANAAHQLRTPIMAIVGAAELLATGEDADPAIKRRLLNHIFSEGRRMQRLSDTLLRLSRIGWDQREPDLEIVGLREAGQLVAELMEPLAESAGLRILVEGEEARVHADSEWLQEVLLVLLSNAIKHSSRGGDIEVRIRSGVITVRDEGTGISSADLPHIFERFYRGRDSSEGFGLGLSICKELTERMGGAISIRSREGVGTTVEIELPEASVDAQHTDR